MFIIIYIIILIVILLILYYTKSSFTTKPFIDKNKVKYILNNSDKNYFKRYGKELVNQTKLPKNGIFYTTTPWSTKNNNYFKYKENYYIIEPGYYYNIIPEMEFYINSINVVFIE